jgi:hypothetical protein
MQHGPFLLYLIVCAIILVVPTTVLSFILFLLVSRMCSLCVLIVPTIQRLQDGHKARRERKQHDGELFELSWTFSYFVLPPGISSCPLPYSTTRSCNIEHAILFSFSTLSNLSHSEHHRGRSTRLTPGTRYALATQAARLFSKRFRQVKLWARSF